MTSESALAALVVPDIERLIETVENHVSDSDLYDEAVDLAFERARSVFIANGLTLGDATVRIEDSFPEPYHDLDASAMNYDISDHENYGIDIGVVLKRQYLMPLYTSTLIAHELTHMALGQVNTQYLARGLEEGLAELFGTVFVGGEILDPSVSEAILINSRLTYPPGEQRWRIYDEAVRQAAALVVIDGWSGIVELLRRANRDGRGHIKKAERELLLRARSKTPSIKAGLAPDTSRGRMADFVETFLCFPQNLVVSPLSLFLAERLGIGMGIDELLTAHAVQSEAGKQAIKELHDRTFLIISSDGQIRADETKIFVETGTLRYEISSETDPQ